MLTAKQLETYKFICRYIKRYKQAPTEAEIATGIGIKSTGVVHKYVTAIAKEGLITTIPKRRRNIKVLIDDESIDTEELPITGIIAAGFPIEALVTEKTLNIHHQLLGDNRFVLQVHGDSMLGDNICDGDYIICEKCNAAPNNRIVVALIDNQEATLKRIIKNRDKTVTLIPSNPNFPPVKYAINRIQVQGIYLGLLRLP